MTFLNFTIPSWSPLIAYNAAFEGVWMDVSTDETSGAPLTPVRFATDGPHANATLIFTGTSITLFGSKGPINGNYTVQLDNGPATTYNGHMDSGDPQVALWDAQNLNNSEHTFEVTNKHSPQGIAFALDFITVGRELGPPDYTGPIFNATFDDTSSFIVYNGPWTSATSSAGFNNTLHSTDEAGSSLSLHFRGSSIELYGINADAEYEVEIDNRVTAIGPGKNTVFFNQSHQSPPTLFFYTDGLDENATHVVTLANSNSNANNPLYFDYAIVRSSQNSFVGTISSPSPSKPHSTTGIVIGSVLGGVGFIIICLVGLVFLRRNRRCRLEPTGNEPDKHNVTITPVAEVASYTISKPKTTMQLFPSQSEAFLDLAFEPHSDLMSSVSVFNSTETQTVKPSSTRTSQSASSEY